MSFASSAVTYTSVYTDSEPGRVFWGADEELSDGEPMYPEYIPLEDEHVLLAEEQPLPPVDSPIAESLGYVAESDPEEDPDEYKDDESEDGPVDYPIDWGDDGDDDDDNSSRDDTDDEDEDEEEEEEENLAPADSAVVIPTIELVTSPEGTGPVIPLPSTDIATTRASITVCLRASISIPPEVEVERILAMPTPPPSPLASLSPPSAGSALLASTQALIDAVTTALPSPPLPPPIYIPPPVDRRDDVPETEMPPHKRLCLSTLSSRYEIGESSTARPTGGRKIDYRDTWVDPTEADPEIAPMNLGEASGTDGRDSLSDGRHETRDGGHYESSRGELDSQDRMLDSLITSMLLGMLIVTSRGLCYFIFLGRFSSMSGTEGMVGLTWWIEKMELVFQISGCAIENQVKFATCTLLDTTLTWWNSQIRSLGPDAYSMTWEVLKKKMTNKYCPQGEIKKLEIELWKLKFKGNDVPTYTKRFQELTLICTKFVANETKKIEKYIRGLPDNIYGSVKSSKPKTLDETIELANDFMDQKLRTYVERQTNNKRKADDLSRNNHGHFARDCRSSGNTNVTNTQRDNRAIPKGNGCSECGASGHFKRDCLKLKNKDGGYVNAQGWVYTVGNAEKKGNV
uniref:Reverse transcriptase domain-containing protein n=1 Tax=Tanacetum cinerariifolium TaxID=118510 RepID=A0A699IPP5_TANCI|nr:reverse transcriptase domain-containing protein [Tanacetum cinerariifolium]